MRKEPGWVPMPDPLAYLLTWTTYGSWLPGDQRGWFAKPGQFQPPDAQSQEAARRLMTDSAVILTPQQRRLVEDTIAGHCRIRGWKLHAVSARTQHVHVVVTAHQSDPADVMNQLKAWCTRRLKERVQSCPPVNAGARQKWWTQGGSKRWLNDEYSLEEAIRYVLELQGDPTPRPADEDTQA